MALDGLESEDFPYLPLTLTIGARAFAITALLDTGFDGDLAAPLGLIAHSQPPDEYRSWSLADGSVLVAPLYYGTVQIGSFDQVPTDIVGIGDEAMVGRGVSDRYRIILDHGDRLIVER